MPPAHDPTHAMLITMAAAISAGVMLIVLARRTTFPAIVLLLFGGIALGPQLLNIIRPDSLGDGLRVIVSMSVGLILFEGGLTLDLSGYRTAPTMIKRLLSIGVLVTWSCTALALRFIVGLPTAYAVIAASLVIVTGPTVIAPLLKRIRVTTRLHNILHWEGVLIDPIGVFIALLCFEWISGQGGQMALLNLGIRVGWGMAVGIGGGVVIAQLISRHVIPEEMTNVFALGFAVFIFGLADAVQPEAGLLAVTVAGFVFGLTRAAPLKQVRRFKAEITDLLIGTLFMLLGARLSFDQFADFGVTGLLAVAVVIFLVRPLSIALCSFRLDLTNRERIFLGWVAPRGIVAASMASLLALNLEQLEVFEDPRFVETFTYSVIIGTIVLQGLTAGPLMRLLGLERQQPTGWLIVGAHELARRVALFIRESAGYHTVLVDTNARMVREAGHHGLTALAADARDITIQDRHELQGVGSVLALTDNEDLNVRICQAWGEVVGPANVFRCHPGEGEPGTAAGDGVVPAGRVIWSRLPKPSLLAGEIARGEALVQMAPASDMAMAQIATPLAGYAGGRVLLDPDPAALEGPPEDVRVLYLQRATQYLLRSLRPELITPLEVTSLRELFEELADRMVRVYPKLPRGQIVTELLERETAFPTALGHGVAVPHAYSSAVDGRLCAVATIPDGLDFGAPDGEPVRLVFLLISPQGDPEGHLATLAEIARLVFDAETRERLMDARSAMEVIRIVREEGRKR